MSPLNNYFGDLKQIFFRLKNRNFSGTSGQAIENSTYQFFTNLSSKIGALLFTVLMARILMPELFGLYSLALSTILIFVAFSDLGIGETLIRFVSREFGKGKKQKAESYLAYLIKLKFFAVLFISVILIVISKFISENYYHKPLTFALIAGGIYVFFVGVVATFQSILQAYNQFKPIFYRETAFQIIRIICIPLLVLLALKYSVENETILFIIIFSLALTYIISSVVLYLYSRKTTLKSISLKTKISFSEKKTVNRFVLITSATILSGVFFGYIDIIMLGYFVSPEYLGFYQAAFSFIGAITPLITFSTAMLPVLSRLNKKNTDMLFNRAIRLISFVSVISFFFLILISKYLILFIFGSQYLDSVNILRIFSLLLISMPIISIYSTYFVSTGKPEIVTKSLIYSTIINIILNFLFISYLIRYGMLYAVYGATVATIISRYIYMGLLVFYRRRI